MWSCEQDGNVFGMLYQLTPLPRNRLFALANQGLAFSDDGSCGWKTAGGAVDGQSVTDAFLDPVARHRVLAIGVANQTYSVSSRRTRADVRRPRCTRRAAGTT